MANTATTLDGISVPSHESKCSYELTTSLYGKFVNFQRNSSDKESCDYQYTIGLVQKNLHVPQVL